MSAQVDANGMLFNDPHANQLPEDLVVSAISRARTAWT